MCCRTRGLDRLESQGAIRSGARKHHPDCIAAVHVGDGTEEHIDRSRRTDDPFAWGELEVSIRQRHLGAWRNDVGVVSLDAQLVGGLHHGDDRRARQQLGEDAFVCRTEVLDEYVRQSGVGGRRPSNWVSASRPPTEAPTAITRTERPSFV